MDGDDIVGVIGVDITLGNLSSWLDRRQLSAADDSRAVAFIIDGDGKVTAEERQAAREAMRAAWQERRAERRRQ